MSQSLAFRAATRSSRLTRRHDDKRARRPRAKHDENRRRKRRRPNHGRNLEAFAAVGRDDEVDEALRERERPSGIATSIAMPSSVNRIRETSAA